MKLGSFLAPLSLSALLLATSSASAQSARFSDIDRNGDGLLSYRELVQSFGRSSADRLWAQSGGDALSRSDVSRINRDRDDDDRDDDDDDDDRDDDDDDDRDDDDDDDRDDDDDDDDDRGRDDDDDDRDDDDDDD